MKKLMFAVVAIGLYASSSMASSGPHYGCYNDAGRLVPCAADTEIPTSCTNAWGMPVPCAE